MSSQVVRIASGGTLQIRSGVLRGAGPQGPMGPPGPEGKAGVQGPQGPEGVVSDVAFRLSSASSVSTGIDQWYQLSFETVLENKGLVTPRDNYTFSPLASGRYLVTSRVVFAKPTTSNASGTRQLHLVDANNNEIALPTSVSAVPGDDTTVSFSETVTLDSTKLYRLEARSRDNTAILATSRTLTVTRIGAGPPGPAGPLGPVGQQGAAGPQGPAGNATAGFTTFDALIAGTSNVDPGGTIATTADQGVPVPAIGQKPAVPYFMIRMAQFLEKRVMARFASVADREAKRATRTNGEMYTILDSGTPFFVEKIGGDATIARVRYSTSPPPTGAGAAAPGVLWAQY